MKKIIILMLAVLCTASIAFSQTNVNAQQVRFSPMKDTVGLSPSANGTMVRYLDGNVYYKTAGVWSKVTNAGGGGGIGGTITAGFIPYASGANTLSNSSATYVGPKFTFAPTLTTSGFNFGASSGNPSGLINGDAWYNSITGKTTFREGGSTITIPALSAGTNELPKSSSGNLVPSGIFNTTLGDLSLGNSLSGTNRQISVEGSGSNVSLQINAKGSGDILAVSGNNSIKLYGGQPLFTFNTSTDLTFRGGDGSASAGLENGFDLTISAGNSITSGNRNGGTLLLQGGNGNGSGIPGGVFVGTPSTNDGLNINTSYITNGYANSYKYGLWSNDNTQGSGVIVGIGDLTGIGDGSYTGLFTGDNKNEMTIAASDGLGDSFEFLFQMDPASPAHFAGFDDNRVLTGQKGLEYGGDYSAGFTARSLIDVGWTSTKWLSGSAALDFPNTTTGIADLTITLTGATAGKSCYVGVPNGSITATSTFTCWVSAANTVTVRFSPKAVGGENPASGTFVVTVDNR